MNGAERLVHALLDGGIDLCFANPGTSEMHFVAALDRVAGMRCVLGLAEGVVTGAADGFYRLQDRPAATLLHLGPGLANGLSNLHNAKKAASGIVNIVGDHASAHLALDAPLTSDIAGLAAPMSHWVQRVAGAHSVAADGRAAVQQACARPGRVATLILPADAAWSDAAGPAAPAPPPEGLAAPEPPDAAAVRQAADWLRTDGSGTLLLLGGRALRADATVWAGRIAAATGCGVMSAFYGARIQRGAGRVAVPRVPYSVDAALAVLAPYRQVVLVEAEAPVAFFAYPGKPGRLTPASTALMTLSRAQQDARDSLSALAAAVGAGTPVAGVVPGLPASPALPTGPLDAASVAAVVARRIPEDGIVVDESISTGRAFDAATRQAAPHDWLTGMGGSIGFGLPVAIGAALGAPGRRVLVLEGDGSAMYTPQALWTLAREGLDVTVLIFANRAYRILLGEFAGVGAGAPGQRAADMLSIDRPTIDWLGLSRALGVPATRATTVTELDDQLARALQTPGPALVEVVL